MAPVLEKRLPGAAGAGDNNNEDEEGQNLWQVPPFNNLMHFSTRRGKVVPY